MNSELIVSTNGNKVTFSTGFNDVPQHHISVKRKATTNSYTNLVKSEFSFVHQSSKLGRRIAKNEALRHIDRPIKQLYTVMEAVRFVTILYKAQLKE